MHPPNAPECEAVKDRHLLRLTTSVPEQISNSGFGVSLPDSESAKAVSASIALPTKSSFPSLFTHPTVRQSLGSAMVQTRTERKPSRRAAEAASNTGITKRALVSTPVVTRKSTAKSQRNANRSITTRKIESLTLNTTQGILFSMFRE